MSFSICLCQFEFNTNPVLNNTIKLCALILKFYRMEKIKLNLLLADDDIDDCDFFTEAIDEISEAITLSVLNDGVELMNFLLAEANPVPHLVFLDINMPRKSGSECLEAMKSSPQLRDIPVVIYSTSLDRTVVNQLYDLGAHYYIQKPGEFGNIKKAINKAILQVTNPENQLRSRDHFIIQP